MSATSSSNDDSMELSPTVSCESSLQSSADSNSSEEQLSPVMSATNSCNDDSMELSPTVSCESSLQSSADSNSSEEQLSPVMSATNSCNVDSMELGPTVSFEPSLQSSEDSNSSEEQSSSVMSATNSSNDDIMELSPTMSRESSSESRALSSIKSTSSEVQLSPVMSATTNSSNDDSMELRPTMSRESSSESRALSSTESTSSEGQLSPVMSATNSSKVDSSELSPTMSRKSSSESRALSSTESTSSEGQLSPVMSATNSSKVDSRELSPTMSRESSSDSKALSSIEFSSYEEKGCFTLIWEIKKFHLLLEPSKIRGRKGECFSPSWKTTNRNVRSENVWCLRAYEKDKEIKFWLYACYNKQNFLDTCTVSLVDKNGKEVTCQEESSKQTFSGNAKSNVFYINTKNVLDALTPTSKTLTVCCTMWQEQLNTDSLRIYSELIEVSHIWTAENFKSYSFFGDTFIERNIRFFLTFDRKDETRQYALIIGAAPISNDDTLSFVVCDSPIKDGGGKIETSSFNFPLCNTYRSKIKIFGQTKPDGTFQIELYCTVAVHKFTDPIN